MSTNRFYCQFLIYWGSDGEIVKVRLLLYANQGWKLADLPREVSFHKISNSQEFPSSRSVQSQTISSAGFICLRNPKTSRTNRRQRRMAL